MVAREQLRRIREELDASLPRTHRGRSTARSPRCSPAITCCSSARPAPRSRCSPTSSAGASTAPSYFQWLLTKFTTPEELFGAVSPARPRARRLPPRHHPQAAGGAHRLPRRGVQGQLVDPQRHPHADERAPLPQRPRRRSTVPLITLFGASNELPEDDELQALYDRFLLRFVVDYIADDFRFLRMLQGKPAADAHDAVARRAAAACRRRVRAVSVPQHVFRSLADIRRELGRKQIIASDRRYHQAVGLLQAARLPRRPRRGRRGGSVLPRARALARSERAQRGARDDPSAAARLRRRGEGAAVPDPGAARLRAPPVGEQRPAQPRRGRGAHQDPQHPRQGDAPSSRTRAPSAGRWTPSKRCKHEIETIQQRMLEAL